MSEGVEVSALDHVHLYVADVQQAAAWYGRVLGLRIHPSSARLGERGLDAVYMATARGQYCATIFRGTPPSDGDHTTAFRVTGTVFLAFGEKLDGLRLSNRRGELLLRDDADDHGLAWSYYFADPDGNHLELTTYDHQRVRNVLGERSVA
jgi:catechol 2,3-dioxygenase-like lactoylglutathione lyase family enzyme